eukprot:343484-Rhodomonas_salina.1
MAISLSYIATKLSLIATRLPCLATALPFLAAEVTFSVAGRSGKGIMTETSRQERRCPLQVPPLLEHPSETQTTHANSHTPGPHPRHAPTDGPGFPIDVG